MSKKCKSTPAMIRTATGRTPSQPELQSIKPDNLQTDFYAGAVSGRFSAKVENTSNAGRSDLVSLDYATIEQRVTAMLPAFAAPYGQKEKTND